MDGISTKVLITGIRSMALELTGSLVPKQPRLGSLDLLLLMWVSFKVTSGRILPCRYEASMCAGDTTVSDQYEKTERERPLLFLVKHWVEWGLKSLWWK